MQAGFLGIGMGTSDGASGNMVMKLRFPQKAGNLLII